MICMKQPAAKPSTGSMYGRLPRSNADWMLTCLGMLLTVSVTAASVQGRDAAVALLERGRTAYYSLKRVWADGGCSGSLVGWSADRLGLVLDIVRRSDAARGFTVLPRRWVV